MEQQQHKNGVNSMHCERTKGDPRYQESRRCPEGLGESPVVPSAQEGQGRTRSLSRKKRENQLEELKRPLCMRLQQRAKDISILISYRIRRIVAFSISTLQHKLPEHRRVLYSKSMNLGNPVYVATIKAIKLVN